MRSRNSRRSLFHRCNRRVCLCLSGLRNSLINLRTQSSVRRNWPSWMFNVCARTSLSPIRIRSIVCSPPCGKSNIRLGGQRGAQRSGKEKLFYGTGRNYTYFVPFNNHAQFYEQYSFAGALEKALGANGAWQLLLDERQCLLGMDAFEHRLRPDLSYRALSSIERTADW